MDPNLEELVADWRLMAECLERLACYQGDQIIAAWAKHTLGQLTAFPTNYSAEAAAEAELRAILAREVDP